MKKYVILLRGINVGGKNTLPMKALCDLLDAEHYQNVKTYIQSGNVVLSAAQRPDDKLSHMIERRFGFVPAVMSLSEAEFLNAVKRNPFTAEDGKSLHFYFCNTAPRLDAERLQSLAAATERYELVGKVFYLHAPDGIGRSKLAAQVEACLGVPTTARNLNTVNKLVQLLKAD